MNSSMQQLRIHSLPFEVPATSWFERLRHLPRPVLLDSNAERNQNQQGRFDIISAQPSCTLVTRGAQTLVRRGAASYMDGGCPFELLRAELAGGVKVATPAVELPFCGGAIGYLAYDLARRLVRLPAQAQADLDLPEMDMAIYDWALVRDHQRRRAYFVARPECDAARQEKILQLLGQPEPTAIDEDFQLTSGFQANLSAQQYRSRYHRIMDYIAAGDCYQVNLTQRFQASYRGSEWQAYKYLRAQSDAPFSAFMQLGATALLSLSPERFVSVRDGLVETKPIKGTRPRSKDAKKDLQNAQLLRNSDKDRAENLMIVDLLRNDLSKACRLGSVQVPKLFEIEAYNNVYHLVSTVCGELREGLHALDLLRGCFPGGSVTGTPKRRAMEIIDELEPQRRALYCGSIAYVDYDGNMDSSIVIRTLLGHRGNLYCWGGGAIVADSDADEEYRESIVKVRYLLEHLQRLSQSAERTQYGGSP